MSIGSRLLLPAVCAGLVAVLSFAVSRPALALDDDGQQNVFSSVFSILDLHLSHPDSEIDYRERSPLVLPPKSDLAKPEAGVTRSAAWPNDPDVARRKKEHALVTLPLESTNGADAARRRAQLLPGPAPRAQAQSVDYNCGDRRDGCDRRIAPTELSSEGAQFKAVNAQDSDAEDVLHVGTEPTRKYLTEPPPGYRKATQTVKATREAPVVVHDGPLDYIRGLMDKKDDDD